MSRLILQVPSEAATTDSIYHAWSSAGCPERLHLEIQFDHVCAPLDLSDFGSELQTVQVLGGKLTKLKLPSSLQCLQLALTELQEIEQVGSSTALRHVILQDVCCSSMSCKAVTSWLTSAAGLETLQVTYGIAPGAEQAMSLDWRLVLTAHSRSLRFVDLHTNSWAPLRHGGRLEVATDLALEVFTLRGNLNGAITNWVLYNYLRYAVKLEVVNLFCRIPNWSAVFRVLRSFTTLREISLRDAFTDWPSLQPLQDILAANCKLRRLNLSMGGLPSRELCHPKIYIRGAASTYVFRRVHAS